MTYNLTTIFNSLFDIGGTLKHRQLTVWSVERSSILSRRSISHKYGAKLTLTKRGETAQQVRHKN